MIRAEKSFSTYKKYRLSHLRRWTFLILLALAVQLSVFLPENVLAETKPIPEITADSAVIIDAKTGTVIYDKYMHKQKYPASTTKVMTGLLAVENLDFSQTVTIDAETPFTEGSRIYLLEGEQVTVEQLFFSMLVESANDSAVALAKLVAGSVSGFAELMNIRARELGAMDTHFVNPNGLEDPEHLTSAYDLAIIAKEGMKYQKFREAVGTYYYHMPATNKQDERFLYNGNRLLYDEKTKVLYEGELRGCKYEGATGIKTGYTQQAGNCLIAGAVRGDTELIAVMLESQSGSLYADAISLLEFGFANYRSVPAFKKGAVQGDIKVKKGESPTVAAVTADVTWVTLSTAFDESTIYTRTTLPAVVEAPVAEGQPLGEMAIFYDDSKPEEPDSILAVQTLVAAAAVDEGGFFTLLHNIFDGSPLRTAALIVGIIIIIGVVYILYRINRLKKKKRIRAGRAAKYSEQQRINEEFIHRHL